MTKNYFEINLDGIVGPTHNYGGLSFGNIASMSHLHTISNPKEAAKQGLAKMHALFKLGIKQAVFPPHERPFLPLLHHLGYRDSPAKIFTKLAQENPILLLIACSSSHMWTANTATTAPSIDSMDGKVHFTAANLINKLHRLIETPTNHLLLNKLFPDPRYFEHHTPLPAHASLSDEGAANHTRFSSSYNKTGIHLFVYGFSAHHQNQSTPKRFPARQSLEASQAIARLHGLEPKHTLFVQQNPEAIDSGVFHNDVISVGNQNVFFYHEDAFVDTPHVIESLEKLFRQLYHSDMHLLRVTSQQVPLIEAVRTYLFNSQLITMPDQTMALIAPTECQQSENVREYLSHLLKDTSHPIKNIFYQDVRQSMQNGGGPACLRLRILLNEEEYRHMHQPVIFTEELYHHLMAWVDRYYRDRLTFTDLLDPQLLQESYAALDALTHLLKLGSVYSFQKDLYHERS